MLQVSQALTDIWDAIGWSIIDLETEAYEEAYAIEVGQIVGFYDDETGQYGVGRYMGYYEDLHHAGETSPYFNEQYNGVYRVVIEDVAECGNLRINYVLEDNVWHREECKNESLFWQLHGAYRAEEVRVWSNMAHND